MSTNIWFQTSKRRFALGLIWITLLVSMLVSQREYLMMVQNSSTTAAVVQSSNLSDSPAQNTSKPSHQTNSDHQGSSSHNHAEHCPLCFMYWLVTDFTFRLSVVYSPLLLEKIWLEAAVAQAEFLNQVAARAPPQHLLAKLITLNI